MIDAEKIADQMRSRLLDLQVGASREEEIILAGVMMETAIDILRRYGKNQDILYVLAEYLTGR